MGGNRLRAADKSSLVHAACIIHPQRQLILVSYFAALLCLFNGAQCIQKPMQGCSRWWASNDSRQKRHQKYFFGQKWLWFDGGFALWCGCVFLVNFYLAWSQRFDLVGSLGDILGYLPSKFEGPSWSGLVTVGLWSQICATAKRREKWYRNKGGSGTKMQERMSTILQFLKFWDPPPPPAPLTTP